MLNKKKMKSISEEGEVSRSRANSVKSKERHASKNNAMSNDTKDFIQKICFRKTASIDMTRYGFINDSKIDPVDYVIKPLREQLERICVKSALVKHRHPSPPATRAKVCEVASPTERKPTCTPKSALSYPGTRTSRSCFRKVRIQNDSNPEPAVTREKKVKLVSPGASKGKNVDKKKSTTKKKKQKKHDK